MTSLIAAGILESLATPGTLAVRATCHSVETAVAASSGYNRRPLRKKLETSQLRVSSSSAGTSGVALGTRRLFVCALIFTI